MYKATITAPGNATLISKVFAPEDKKIKDRSVYTIQKKKDAVQFNVAAKDSVALRAHLTSITKMLTVVEQMQGVK